MGKILSLVHVIKKDSFIVFGIVGMILTSCQPDQKSSTSPVPKIILDTDMGSDCDDVGALALLHAYADKDMVEIVGCIYSSGKVPYGAGIIEAINIYYGRPQIPIGAYHGDEVGDPVDKMTAEKLASDTVAFGNSIILNTDTEEQTRLNRRLLVEAADHSITYITIGHTKGLHELLVSQPDDISSLTGSELIAQKINRWIALGGLNARNEGNHFVKDWNFFFNNTAPYTKYLLENFPAPIYIIDAGSKVMTGKSLINTTPGNIVRTAYRDWLWEVFKKPLDHQRPSWDLTTVYYAVEGLGDFLKSAGNGVLEFDIEKGCRWNQLQNESSQVYIYQKEDTDDSFADYLNEMIRRRPLKSTDL